MTRREFLIAGATAAVATKASALFGAIASIIAGSVIAADDAKSVAAKIAERPGSPMTVRIAAANSTQADKDEFWCLRILRADENLQFRVCGWNVRWNDLPRAEQDAYIRRAENLMK